MIFNHHLYLSEYEDTPYLSVFSRNVGKYRPEITPYLDTFHVVRVGISNISIYVFEESKKVLKCTTSNNVSRISSRRLHLL